MGTWKPVNPAAAKRLSDARRQLHHAAQLATAFGISYLPKKPDDSHTNLEWIESEQALASNALDGKRILVRVPDLTLMIGEQSLPLRDLTLGSAWEWIRKTLESSGLDGSRYTLKRHYEIPSHPVANGAKFNARDDDLDQLARWYSNAAQELEMIRANDSMASEVRCWPHHFDIATLIIPSEGKSVGAGLEPGDKYYDEPYFYVNMNPAPTAESLPESLEGDGMWHTSEWIGAVLPGSRLTSDSQLQQSQVQEFLRSAIDTAKRAVMQA
ncbi:MAG TPA: hypothetical protein VFD22_13910 [Gemmatimonadaceae bacterium]|nr:hypothetical protein [Gemmatimonadaceae bacterium]